MTGNAMALGLPAATSTARKRILVVDDEPDSRQIFRDMLSDLGYDVIDAPDSASALMTMRNESTIDLIITDYQMPDMNGLAFVERVRQFLPAVPIIMITAYGSVETYIRSQSLSVFEYINKPVKKRELDLILKAALQKADNKQEK
jgi:DNA-binding NtrC family response regulator